MAMSKKRVAKAASSRSYRLSVLGGFNFNHEPRFKRERNRCGGWWRNLRDWELLAVAGNEARINEYLLRTGQF